MIPTASPRCCAWCWAWTYGAGAFSGRRSSSPPVFLTAHSLISSRMTEKKYGQIRISSAAAHLTPHAGSVGPGSEQHGVQVARIGPQGGAEEPAVGDVPGRGLPPLEVEAVQGPPRGPVQHPAAVAPAPQQPD